MLEIPPSPHTHTHKMHGPGRTSPSSLSCEETEAKKKKAKLQIHVCEATPSLMMRKEGGWGREEKREEEWIGCSCFYGSGA